MLVKIITPAKTQQIKLTKFNLKRAHLVMLTFANI